MNWFKILIGAFFFTVGVAGCGSSNSSQSTGTQKNSNPTTEVNGIRELGLEPSHKYYQYTYLCKIVGIGPLRFDDLVYDEVKIGLAKGFHGVGFGNVELEKYSDGTWKSLNFFLNSSESESIELGISTKIYTWESVEGSSIRVSKKLKDLNRKSIKEPAGAAAVRFESEENGKQIVVDCKKTDH